MIRGCGQHASCARARYYGFTQPLHSVEVQNEWRYNLNQRRRWSRGSVLAFGTQVRGFAPGRNRRIFRAKKSSARLPSEGNWLYGM
jgi:hypothetical protein